MCTTTDNGSRILQTWNSFGTPNKLFNYQFFAIELPVGTYTLTVTPITPMANTFIRDLDGDGFDPGAEGAADVLTIQSSSPGALVFAVGADTANTTFTVKIGSGSRRSRRRCPAPCRRRVPAAP